MKYFLVCIGCLLMHAGNSAWAQYQRITHYYDADKKYIKETYYVSEGIKPVITGTFTSYYLTGGVKSTGNYINNISQGEWKYFYENGKLKMKGPLKDGNHYGYWNYYYENGNPSMEGRIFDELRQGHWKFYYESGGMKSEGDYLDNQKNGIWNYYYEDGILKAQAFYKELEGTYREFYSSGQVKMEGNTYNSKSEGPWTEYYESGIKQAEGSYKEGQKSGYWIYYYPNGKRSAEGDYTAGQTDGKWLYYHTNGKLSSEGVEREGLKEGYWRLYNEDGSFKGEGVFSKGGGDFKEYYDNGKMKSYGKIINGKNEGKWIYYYENGVIEGECVFANGEGEYVGFYSDGSIKMRGQIKDGIRIGTWKLYDKDGSLAGYYKPIYENNKPIFRLSDEIQNDTLTTASNYQKPEYRYKAKKITNFTKRVNEFKGVIVSTNPGGMIFGNIPISVEYYLQERLGYELYFFYLRRPFFESDNNVDLNQDYSRGYALALRQKLYNKDRRLGMFYYAHELRFVQQNHFLNVVDSTSALPIRTSYKARNNALEYSILVGTRFIRDPIASGLTLDAFIGLGLGYRIWNPSYTNDALIDPYFKPFSSQKLYPAPRIGFTLGYIFSVSKHSKSTFN